MKAYEKTELNTVNERFLVKTIIFRLVVIKKEIYFFVKRTFDIIASALGLVVSSPIIFITAIIIHKNDGGPAFYTQTRIGKDGKEFTIYKLRSMYIDADARLKELLKEDKEIAKEYNKNAKLKNDPRITKIGKIIRKTSIDELPQLINILKGDMSVVGPRPLVKNELAQHHGDSELYESIRPGITGWWACNGRSDVEDYRTRLNLEYYYVEHCGILLDCKCILKTATSVLLSKGAE